MGSKRQEDPGDAPEKIRTLEDIGSDAESALVDLEGALTAARALVNLTLADGGAEKGPVLYKRLNALEFVLRQAGLAEDVLWVTVDKMRMSLDDQLPAPF